MYTLTITANTVEELLAQVNFPMWQECRPAAKPETVADAEPEKLPEPQEIKPVLTQAQMEENVAKAPAHELPPQPTLEEVRAALKELKDRKGTDAVKRLLKDYGANNVPELKPEDYLGAIDRARTEV